MTKLSVSEARAEAVSVVLRLMLDGLEPGERESLQTAAFDEGADIGHPMVEEEIAWLFCCSNN